VHAWAFPLAAWKQDVLLFIDNIFHFVQAGSKVSALLGRMPSAVGYQPTLSTEMGTLQESRTISLPKRLGHHFSPGLTSLAKNTLPIQCWGTFDFFLKTAWFFKTFQIQRTPRFQIRMRDSNLTNSHSPTIQPKLKELGIGF